MTNPRRAMLRLLLLPVAAMAVAAPRRDPPPAAAVAVTRHHVGDFVLALRRDTQTLARLSPAADPAFDFVPGGQEARRSGDGYVHLGDLHLRLRADGADWRDFSSAHARRPIAPLPASGPVFAAADITATMGEGIPLGVERRWSTDGGTPKLTFTLRNRSGRPVEIGGLGLPMVFDNILTERSLALAHAQASFADPYIGQDAGYLQVTRLNGKGPALLVLPERGTPFEAYRPIAGAGKAPPGDIFTDRDPRRQTAEGFYDWTVASKGFAEREWAHAGAPWNRPTGFTLRPGEARTIGVRFALAPSIRAIERTLVADGRPVAMGVPGYVVPTDMDASLFLRHPAPVAHVASEPADALVVTPAGTVGGWSRYAVRGRRWGRARLSIDYADGSVQTIGYFVTKPLDQATADLGRFATTRQWYEGKGDPFGRSPAILTYDREADRIVTQEPRVWIAGMSDEGGAGSWVAAVMKQLDHPDPAEVAKIERLVDRTVVGKLQVASGPHAGAVRKSLFFYDAKDPPVAYDPKADWSTWTSWSRKDAADIGRAYNYPHVAIAHWVLYRLARNHAGLVKAHDWRWYLDHACTTVVAMMRDAPHYAQYGLMEGDVFVDILDDLKREGLTTQAATMERLMRARADHWRGLAYPFGSEMPWDSTGQPEVHAWMRYFGFARQAAQTREVILGYDPTIPSWGYNGNARRYWDFLYGGKYPRIERQLHHYGSALNAVPLLDAYRTDPSDLYLLRVAYGGLMGGITNIDQDGFASAGFHSDPDMMRWDPYSGDYGMGFFGHAYAAATYLVDDPTFGWLGFGGNVSRGDGMVRIVPKDGARTRLYVAPAGLWLTLQAGRIAEARYDPATAHVTLTLDPATADMPAARLFVSRPGSPGRPVAVSAGTRERGGYTIPLGPTPRAVTVG